MGRSRKYLEFPDFEGLSPRTKQRPVLSCISRQRDTLLKRLKKYDQIVPEEYMVFYNDL